jgi:hypothetical protein
MAIREITAKNAKEREAWIYLRVVSRFSLGGNNYRGMFP